MGLEKERRPQFFAAGREYTAAQIEKLRTALGIPLLRNEVQAANGDLARRIIALEGRAGAVEDRTTALEAFGRVSLLGSAAALNLAAVQAYDTQIAWPADLADGDLYIVVGEVNGRIAQIVQGIEITGIDAGAADAALAAGASIPLYPVDVTGAAAIASLGKSADDAGAVLLQPAAADADASLAIFRVVI